MDGDSFLADLTIVPTLQKGERASEVPGALLRAGGDGHWRAHLTSKVFCFNPLSTFGSGPQAQLCGLFLYSFDQVSCCACFRLMFFLPVILFNSR